MERSDGVLKATVKDSAARAVIGLLLPVGAIVCVVHAVNAAKGVKPGYRLESALQEFEMLGAGLRDFWAGSMNPIEGEKRFWSGRLARALFPRKAAVRAVELDLPRHALSVTPR